MNQNSHRKKSESTWMPGEPSGFHRFPLVLSPGFWVTFSRVNQP